MVEPRTGAGNRTILRLLAGLIVLAGLACIVTPFGSWMRLTFGGFEAAVNGYGSEDSDFADGGSDDGGGGLTESSDQADEDSLDWLAVVPDGVPITGLGVLAGALGLFLLLRVTSPPPDAERSRKEILAASVALAGVGGVGFAWTALSWFRLDAQFDDLISESLQDDETGFGAMFAAGIDLKPGYGLILSALGMASIAGLAALAFVVAYTRTERLAIVSVSSATPPVSPGPPPGPPADQWGPPSGQWPPTPPPQPQPGQWSPPPAQPQPQPGQWSPTPPPPPDPASGQWPPPSGPPGPPA